jgi:dTDP-4-dehydrorhamnose 3,5-epimerase
MRFTPTKLAGAVVLEPDRLTDDRGHFARTWCVNEFAAAGLTATWVQSSVAYNRRRGTLRGMHYQTAPHEETKLVRCTRGAAYDVVVDLRPDSPTYRRWVAVELTAENGVALYVPGGFAHGYQTLTDDTELSYLMSEFYHPELARGVRWDDPAIGIDWPPCANRIIAVRDLAFPDLPP